jgi:hypothetical protein
VNLADWHRRTAKVVGEMSANHVMKEQPTRLLLIDWTKRLLAVAKEMKDEIERGR